MLPLSKYPLSSLLRSSQHSEHLLGMFSVVSFWFSSIVKCFHKYIHTKSLASFPGYLPCSQHNHTRSHPKTDITITSVPFDLVSTCVSLISCSTPSVKLLFFQKAMAVIVIADITLQETGGVCSKLIEYSSKCPIPTNVFRGICGNLQYKYTVKL